MERNAKTDGSALGYGGVCAGCGHTFSELFGVEAAYADGTRRAAGVCEVCLGKVIAQQILAEVLGLPQPGAVRDFRGRGTHQ